MAASVNLSQNPPMVIDTSVLNNLRDCVDAGNQYIREEEILSLKDLPEPLKDLSIQYVNDTGRCQDPFHAFVRSILRAANELYDVYPEQAEKYVEYMNRIVDYWEGNETHCLAKAPEEVPSPLCFLQLKTLVSELNYTADPQWELKLRTVLTATKTLSETLRWRVVSSLLDPITQLWQSPKFPGFASLETIELLRSLFQGYFKWPYEHPQEMSTLLSSYGEGIVAKLEQALACSNTEEQIGCMSQFIGLCRYWEGIPMGVCSLDKTLALGLNVNTLADLFPEGEAYKILSVVAPNVAQAYMNILLERLKSKVLSRDNLCDKKDELVAMAESELPQYIPETGSKIREFVDQQFADIINDIAQGRLSLEARVDESGQLTKDIIKRYENNMETLVKTLGDHAKTFFKIYGRWKVSEIHFELCRGDLDGALRALKGYIKIPSDFQFWDSRTWVTDPSRHDPCDREFFTKAMESIFIQLPKKLGMEAVVELMKLGQLCCWMKKLFFLEMPCPNDREVIFEYIVSQIKDQGMEKPEWMLQSLEGDGYAKPEALIQALPFDEAQKARLVQVYYQTS